MDKLKISTPDDSSNNYTTYFGISGDEYERHYGRYMFRNFNNNFINHSRNRSSHEPIIDGIKDWLTDNLGLRSKGRGEFTNYIKLGDPDNPCIIMFSKNGTRYNINGMVQAKETLLLALARTVYRSCFNTDPKKLTECVYNHIMLPENVSYALENRAPFHWYKKGERIDVRFNVKMISEDECAMEISDGVWGPINVGKLNTYMNYYWKGKARGTWKFLSPKKLWKKLLKTSPTENQQKVMIAFLEQNRTDDIVEERAISLIKDLEKQFPKTVKVMWYSPGESNKSQVKAILVRGQIADWVITNNEYKSEIQAVSTYIFSTHLPNGGACPTFKNGVLNGPICIDNMTRHSSVGDQFAARVYALLNDSMTIQIVSTISRYINEQHYKGQENQRIDFDEVTNEELP
jgi:hypothetical protein